jgi:hypothetical protein
VTAKYLKAISRKLWIVSIQWILNSAKSGQLLKPDRYEIRGDPTFGSHYGPMNSRKRRRNLFESYEFVFVGKYRADPIDIQEIIQWSAMNGAKIRTKAKDFSEDTAEQKTRCVIFDSNETNMTSKNAQLMLSAQIHCLDKKWILDSLACYKIRGMDEYKTYDTEN